MEAMEAMETMKTMETMETMGTVVAMTDFKAEAGTEAGIEVRTGTKAGRAAKMAAKMAAGKRQEPFVMVPFALVAGLRSPLLIATWVVLKTYCIKSNTCYPSLPTMASVLGCHRQTVLKAIKKLEALGFINVWRDQKHNFYQVFGDASLNPRFSPSPKKLPQRTPLTSNGDLGKAGSDLGKAGSGVGGNGGGKPRRGEVENYIKQKGLKVNAAAFMRYYEESGWLDSKGVLVQNWRQKLILWHLNPWTSGGDKQAGSAARSAARSVARRGHLNERQENYAQLKGISFQPIHERNERNERNEKMKGNENDKN